MSISAQNVLFSDLMGFYTVDLIVILKIYIFLIIMKILYFLTGALSKLYKFITGSHNLTPLGTVNIINVRFKYGCQAGCRCRPTASTCDPAFYLPIHYEDMAQFKFCNGRGCGIWTYIVIGEVIQWQLLYPYISLSMLPIYISPNTIPSWPRFDWVIILLQNIGEHSI